MKTSEIRAAIAALAILTGPALAQEAAPPTAAPAQPGPPRGPRMMPASEKAKTFESKSLGATVT